MTNKKIEVARYEHTNETINNLLNTLEPDESVWICTGFNNRLVIIARDEEDAERQYRAKPHREFATLLKGTDVDD